MTHIILAYRGRVDLLQGIFGGGKKAERGEPEWQGNAPGTLTNILKRFGNR